jgi:hypothetical protein
MERGIVQWVERFQLFYCYSPADCFGILSEYRFVCYVLGAAASHPLLVQHSRRMEQIPRYRVSSGCQKGLEINPHRPCWRLS